MSAGLFRRERRVGGEGGVSLVEAMVAVGLGVIIIGAALDVFVTHHGRFRAQRVMAELQQDLRGGVSLLASELRLAGSGAAGVQPFLTAATMDEVAFRANVNGVRGTLLTAATSGQNWAQVPSGSGWRKGKTIVICGTTGCEEQVLAQDCLSGRLVFLGHLTKSFPVGSQVEVVNQVRYYLNRKEPKNLKLMREVDRGANPLIEHVEEFSLTYLNKSGRPAGRMEEIRLVRLSLQTGGDDSRGGRVSRSHTQEMGVRAL